jgi:L-lactate dehydrogenase (cytochrome)
VFPTLRALPEVAAAVRGRTEVLMDGGIRRGSDIVKALLLGARAVLIGRAYVYGLAAAGGAGVSRAIEILTADLNRTLRLLGCASLADLDRSMIEVPFDFARGRRRLPEAAPAGEKLEAEGDGRASASDIH